MSEKKRTRITRFERQRMVMLFEQGNSKADVARQTGRSITSVYSVLGEVGLDNRWVNDEAWKEARRDFNVAHCMEPYPNGEFVCQPEAIQDELIAQKREEVLRMCERRYKALMTDAAFR